MDYKPSDRQLKRMERIASNRRMEQARQDTRDVVAVGRCPICQAPVRRNLALTGWYQCSQFGAVGFRSDSTKPPCNWQGFTE